MRRKNRRIGVWETKDDVEEEPTWVQGRRRQDTRTERYERGQKERRD